MCEEGFHFYLEVTKYREADPGILASEFARIRAKFIGSGAPFQVNIPDHMVKLISQRADEPTKDSFEEAFGENRKVLVTDVFPAYKIWKQTKELRAKLTARTDPANWARVVTRKKSTKVAPKLN
jgi:hypothetical protein